MEKIYVGIVCCLIYWCNIYIKLNMFKLNKFREGWINIQIRLLNNKEYEFILEFYLVREGEMGGYYRF